MCPDRADNVFGRRRISSYEPVSSDLEAAQRIANDPDVAENSPNSTLISQRVIDAYKQLQEFTNNESLKSKTPGQ